MIVKCNIAYNMGIARSLITSRSCAYLVA